MSGDCLDRYVTSCDATAKEEVVLSQCVRKVASTWQLPLERRFNDQLFRLLRRRLAVGESGKKYSTAAMNKNTKKMIPNA